MRMVIRVLTVCVAVGVMLGVTAFGVGQEAAPAIAVGADGQATTQPTSQAAPTTRAAGGESDVIEGQVQEWLAKMKEGGWTIAALAFLSVIGLATALERLAMLRRGRIVPRRLADRADGLWRKGQFAEIITLCDRRPCTLGRILTFIVRHRKASIEDVSTTCGDIAARELKRHLLRAYPLAVVATLAPLLGLLGTVIGMIEAFDTVVLVGMGDATALAGGISKALITTMVGLCIAVPALFLYHIFKSRTSLFGVMLEEEVTELISDWRMVEEPSHES